MFGGAALAIVTVEVVCGWYIQRLLLVFQRALRNGRWWEGRKGLRRREKRVFVR